MTKDELQEFFEESGFMVHINSDSAELEMWTDGGVNMIIYLKPFTKEKFIEYVDNFDIDEEIDLHRQGDSYKKTFTITQSVKDFTDYHSFLLKIAQKIK